VHGFEEAVNAQDRRRPDGDMEIAGAGLDHLLQKFPNTYVGHGIGSPIG
jgi:hypothetical protein